MKKKYIIGIDVGGTNVKLGVIDPSGIIVDRSRLQTKSFIRNKDRLITAIMGAYQELISRQKFRGQDILGIGIGLPGLVDPTKGVVKYLPNIPGWRNVPLVDIVKGNTKRPVFIDNDVNLITLAEWKYGAGRNYKNLVCITLGTGVGGGLILDNRIYRGEGFMAGEIGHVPYRDKTLELYIGNTYLQARAAKVFKDNQVRLEDIFQLASQGDERAIGFWEEMGEHIGAVMAGVVNVLNPRLIVIGGGVSNNYKFFAPSLKRTIKIKAMKIPARMVRVVRARLGDDAGIKGAAILVKESNVEN